MSSILVLTTILSTQIPEAAVDRTWGHLMRATHFTGEWHVAIDDRKFSGDWVVVDAHVSSHRFGMRRWAHFISSTTADYCAIAIDEPGRMTCEKGTERAHGTIPPDAPITRPVALDTTIARNACERGSCSPVHAGTMRTKLRPRRATTSQAERLFVRIHERTVETAIGATREGTRGLRLRMPYRIVTQTVTHSFMSRTVEGIEVVATLTLGPTPKAEIVPHEVGRYIEDCTDRPSGCHPMPPSCTPRGAKAGYPF
jgi:hypothetical protein